MIAGLYIGTEEDREERREYSCNYTLFSVVLYTEGEYELGNDGLMFCLGKR